MDSKFKGIYSAIFSVYDDNADVKKETVRKMVDFQLDGGLKGFYVCGNTGECTILPEKTRKQMLETVVEANNGRGQIIAHIGAGHFDETKRLLEHANSLPIDAVASLPPSLTSYYGLQDTLEYYRELARISKVPVFAYITPVLRGNPVKFAEELIKIPNIAGIKLTISDYYAFGGITALNGGTVNVLNGPDETMLCGLSLGAQGAIGTTYNFAPKLACTIYDSFQKGDMSTALAAQRRLNKIIDIALGNSLSYWKAILGLRGFDMGSTVFPGKNVSSEEMEKLEERLKEVGYFES